jgi:hypothetical protein
MSYLPQIISDFVGKEEKNNTKNDKIIKRKIP